MKFCLHLLHKSPIAINKECILTSFGWMHAFLSQYFNHEIPLMTFFHISSQWCLAGGNPDQVLRWLCIWALMVPGQLEKWWYILADWEQGYMKWSGGKCPTKASRCSIKSLKQGSAVTRLWQLCFHLKQRYWYFFT